MSGHAATSGLSDRSFPKTDACVGRVSPDGYGDRQCERGDHEAEVDPGPISLRILGKHEKMDHDPQTHRKSQRKPDEIAGGLVTDAKVSLWGLLTRTVTTTSAPINTARRAIANTRSPIGMVDGGVPTVGEPSCCGLTLMEWLWPIPPVSGSRLYV